MRKYLVIAACLGFLLFTGCNRCGMWDWYSPCDLVEGAGSEPVCNPCDGGGGVCSGWTESQAYEPCDPCGPQTGQVMKTEWVYPVGDCQPVPMSAAAAAPAAPAAPDALPAPVVDTPPAVDAPPAAK